MIKKILTLLLAVAEIVLQFLRLKEKTQRQNEKVVDDAKDKIDNKASGADVHTAIDGLRQR
jgi:hypothetical protein